MSTQLLQSSTVRGLGGGNGIQSGRYNPSPHPDTGRRQGPDGRLWNWRIRGLSCSIFWRVSFRGSLSLHSS